jgi:hypothetical protein
MGRLGPPTMLKRTLAAALHMAAGLAVGLLLLEAVLRLNPQLLIPGTPLAGSLAAPLTSQTYTVRYSDGDTFFWRPDLIRPVPPAADQVEAVVTLRTDEFGFRNPPPVPAKVYLAVLGRSTTLGAQSAHPWPELLAAQTGWYVLNLAQPAGGLDIVQQSFDIYGRSRRPRWVIFEVAPRLDVSDSGGPLLRLQGVAIPLLQYLARRLAGDRLFRFAAQPIYPLSVDLPGRVLALTCCLHYMDFLALSRADLEGSREWAAFRAQVMSLASDARAGGSCVAALYATSKEEVYFSAALDPAQLAPAVASVVPLRLDATGRLSPAAGAAIGPAAMQSNILASRDAMAALAQQAGLILIDPTEPLIQSVQAGHDPFMSYDSHWNALGHDLIARQVERALQGAACP